MIETFGNASAQFPDDTVDANIVQVTGNATPATALAANIASLDVAVSSRATPAQVNTEADTALADYDPPTKAELDTAVANVTVGTIATAALAAIADKLLGRSIAGGADGGRTVTSAFRRIRNRNVLSAGTLTTYEEDDSTTDHTAAVTTAAGDPFTSVDPV